MILRAKSLGKVLSAQKVQGCFQAARLCVPQFFRMVPTACLGLLSPLTAISFLGVLVWWCPDSRVEEFVHDFNRLRVVRVSKKCEGNREDKVCARFWVHKNCSSFTSFRLLLLRAVGCHFRSQAECGRRSCLSNGSRVDGLDAKLQHHWDMLSLGDMKENVSDSICLAPFKMKCQIELRLFCWA